MSNINYKACYMCLQAEREARARAAELEQQLEQAREALKERNVAIEAFVSLLTEYYWHADDPELEAVNRLRRLIGWRDQLPMIEEVELQVKEAEQEE